jgi:NAD(P)-dependent dehydrogenase (short-subunit alcohol dehydrogenase family)
MECWSLQQKKLNTADNLPLQGQTAVVTGAAGAIGAGVADRLLTAGAMVVISDIDKKGLDIVYSVLMDKHHTYLLDKEIFDVTDVKSVQQGFNRICQKTGGFDILVPNAGIAHVARIEQLEPEMLDKVIDVNLKGTYSVIKAAIPVFRRQETGGNIIVISSKNVFDPGAAFGAYSASKAGAHQISKVAALELAEMGVRVNMVNPDAVFGDDKIPSKLWEVVGPDRMKSRGLDPEGLQDYYQQRNLLKTKVLAEHVGNAVVFFASNLTPTTGAALPVDGGNPATFSR